MSALSHFIPTDLGKEENAFEYLDQLSVLFQPVVKECFSAGLRSLNGLDVAKTDVLTALLRDRQHMADGTLKPDVKSE